ncbi:TBC1 domain family member 22A isoform X2 [Numida meleagris]|uniref:TBC1 domain family member 22A isoform X2 n=1 Tax=Numida meleagris TaxID=8996 RepID=UPI000B3DE585|nr:TBC1 domain family member 22A isoform X2 [Numida meleagris]
MANDGGRKQFWKRSGTKVPGSIQHVYGAQHPPFDPLLHGTLIKPASKPPTTPVKLKKVSTFQEFESNTSDAWDLGDDDDELLAIAAENLNTEVVMETAHKVIQNHSKLQEQHKFLEEHLQEEKQVESAELTSVACGDNRLVKSVSEGHTSSSSDNASENSSMQRSQSLPQTSTSPLVSGMADFSTSVTPALTEREASRLDKFKQLLAGPNTDLEELRKLSWSGIPKRVRPIAWKLLSGYLPANVDRRESTLQRKRKEYFAFVEQYYDSRNDESHQDTYRQIHIDIPRMSPEVLRLQPKVTEIFERILFIWAIRHPASGYVQGINDLVTPFFVVFICEYIVIYWALSVYLEPHEEPEFTPHPQRRKIRAITIIRMRVRPLVNGMGASDHFATANSVGSRGNQELIASQGQKMNTLVALYHFVSDKEHKEK